MASTSLLPGFRFHPTDVELVMYYLKRKVMGKKLHFEAIAEVNIYKFSPWDLPDKSCLKSKDLEWFFFCPREKKYASGARVKRATENGYWKTTGKDRPVHYSEKTVGSVKTLVFHLGHAPQGERTDWVIHEYRILDDQLAALGVQDTYALCKVFKKNGPGPKNGAQYGAPFNEADWADDDDAPSHEMSFTSGGPSPTEAMIPERQISLETGFFDLGSSSGLPLVEGPLPSVGPSTGQVLLEEADDEIDSLLAQFTDDDTLGFHENGISQDDLVAKENNQSLPFPEDYDIYNGLGDLDCRPRMNVCSIDIPGIQDGYLLKDMILGDNFHYIELNDFAAPLNCSSGVLGTNHSSTANIFGSDEYDMASYGSSFLGIDQHGACANQIPVLPEGSIGDTSLDVFEMVNDQFYQPCNPAIDLDTTHKQAEK